MKSYFILVYRKKVTMKILLFLMSMLLSSALLAQYADDQEMNKAINNSKYSKIIDRVLFEGFYFGMSATQYAGVLDSLVKIERALKKGDTYLILRNSKQTGHHHLQSLIPSFNNNQLVRLIGIFLYENDMDKLINSLDFESDGFKKYKYKLNHEEFYFLIKNNIMISTQISSNKFMLRYVDNNQIKE